MRDDRSRRLSGGLALALMAPLWGGCAIAAGGPDDPLGEVSDELGQIYGEAADGDVGEYNDVDSAPQSATAQGPLDGQASLAAVGGGALVRPMAHLRAEEKQEPEPLPWHEDGEASGGRGAPAGSDKAH